MKVSQFSVNCEDCKSSFHTKQRMNLKAFLSFALRQITSASLLIFQGKSANPWDLRFLNLQAATDNSLYTCCRCVCLKSFKVIKMRRHEAVKNQ